VEGACDHEPSWSCFGSSAGSLTSSCLVLVISHSHDSWSMAVAFPRLRREHCKPRCASPLKNRSGRRRRLSPIHVFQKALTCLRKSALQVCRLSRDGWRCQSSGTRSSLEVRHKQFRSRSGDDSEESLITLLRCVPHRSASEIRSASVQCSERWLSNLACKP